MTQLLIPIKGKIIPPDVWKELKTWNQIHKSPYGDSYYNVENISWTHKPEGSLRISDHWNFESKGEIHCPLGHTTAYIQNQWLLCRYEKETYHVIKDYGEKQDGYLYETLSVNYPPLIGSCEPN